VIFDLVLGLLALAAGTGLVTGRHRIVANHKRRFGRAETPAMGWIVIGGLLLTLVGVLALIKAFT